MKTGTRKIASRVSKRKKPSGAEFKKRRRERIEAAAKASGLTPTAIVIPAVGSLESVADWHRELADIYRRTRIGDMRQEDGSRLAWIAKESARIAGTLQELNELQQLRLQLAQLNGPTLPRPVARCIAGEAIEQ